ncbi:MAG TPA: hypothetical protein VMZ28_31470, partial [Kofleriaceae bacterium]|nr:hypothetical protein [Kofleriaceae bacterium]
MIQLQEPGLVAPPPILTDERAALTIARDHLAPHRRRHVSPRPALCRRPRLLHLAELPRLDLLEQHVQRPVDDGAQVTAGQLVPEQRLRAL